MTRGARVLPLRDLMERYMDGGGSRLGGLWYDAQAVVGRPPEQLRTLLGLDWTRPDGRPAFDPHDVGLLLFPVTRAVLLATVFPLTASFGGAEPDPPHGALALGNGFAPGPERIAEHRLHAIALPEGTQACVVADDGEAVILARWLGGLWRLR